MAGVFQLSGVGMLFLVVPGLDFGADGERTKRGEEGKPSGGRGNQRSPAAEGRFWIPGSATADFSLGIVSERNLGGGRGAAAMG